MKVKVVRELCIGVSNCVAVAPTVFQLDSENKAVIVEGGQVSDRTLKTAAESCPVQAIILEDDEGNQIYP
jgi:ferredoxin